MYLLFDFSGRILNHLIYQLSYSQKSVETFNFSRPRRKEIEIVPSVDIGITNKSHSTLKLLSLKKSSINLGYLSFYSMFSFMVLKLANALSMLSIISSSNISGSGRFSKSISLSSFSQKISRFVLSLPIKSL